MTNNTTILTLGEPLNDVDLASFHGASSTVECVVTVSEGTGAVIMTGNCEGVTVKER